MKTDTACVKTTHRSRHYSPDISWTNKAAWAFEIPLSEFSNEPDGSIIVLRCENSDSDDEPYELYVPVQFLRENLASFHRREDHASISIFLSADESDTFQDQRGKGRISFGEFVIQP